jgi:hypothetical protein
MSFVTHFVSASPATYAIVFGIVAIDSLLPFAQAEAVVITAAVLAAQGAPAALADHPARHSRRLRRRQRVLRSRQARRLPNRREAHAGQAA